MLELYDHYLQVGRSVNIVQDTLVCYKQTVTLGGDGHVHDLGEEVLWVSYAGPNY